MTGFDLIIVYCFVLKTFWCQLTVYSQLIYVTADVRYMYVSSSVKYYIIAGYFSTFHQSVIRIMNDGLKEKTIAGVYKLLKNCLVV